MLSPKLVTKSRPRIVQKTAEPVPQTDFGVCSVARQAERHQKRLAFLQHLSAASNANLDSVAKMNVPVNFDHRNMLALAGVTVEAPAKRGVGRKATAPLGRSRKRRNDDGTPIESQLRKKFKHTMWSLAEAIAVVHRIAEHFNENTYIPTRAQFVSQNQSYLYVTIFNNCDRALGVSRADFSRKLGLKWRLGRSAQFTAVD